MIRFTSLLSAIACGVVFAACGSLQPDIPDPGPVTTTEEPEDRRYTVTYRGTSDASADKVRDLALLRAATITLQKGGDWFEVVTDYSRIQNERKSRFERDPFSEAGDIQGDCGVLGCPSRARPDRLGRPDIDPSSLERSYIVQSFEIIVNSGQRPVWKDGTYDAVEISSIMRARYGSEEN